MELIDYLLTDLNVMPALYLIKYPDEVRTEPNTFIYETWFHARPAGPRGYGCTLNDAITDLVRKNNESDNS